MTVNSTSTLDEQDLATGQQDPLSEAGQRAGETASHLAERAADLGFTQAERGKEQAAEGINQVAESIRRVGMDMEGSQPQIANVAQTAADQAERLANYLRDTDARELLDTVENAARRQPLIFLGGAFVLGLAASRFIKAAGGQSNQWRSYGQGYGTDYRSGSWNGGTTPATGYGTTSGDAFRATGPGGRSNLDELPEEGI
jgi:hypothetical protein